MGKVSKFPVLYNGIKQKPTFVNSTNCFGNILIDGQIPQSNFNAYVPSDSDGRILVWLYQGSHCIVENQKKSKIWN